MHAAMPTHKGALTRRATEATATSNALHRDLRPGQANGPERERDRSSDLLERQPRGERLPQIRRDADLAPFLAGDLADPGHVRVTDRGGRHEQAVGGMLADELAEVRDLTDEGKRVHRDRRDRRAHVAERREARGGILEGLREPDGLPRRPDDQRPEGKLSIPLQA